MLPWELHSLEEVGSHWAARIAQNLVQIHMSLKSGVEVFQVVFGWKGCVKKNDVRLGVEKLPIVLVETTPDSVVGREMCIVLGIGCPVGTLATAGMPVVGITQPG
jgi:hypothetical protein